MIDEVHVVSEPRRGAVLEAVVSRMQILSGGGAIKARIVALSATVPNINDFAEWLRDDKGPAEVKLFGEEFRPVQLQRVVLGYPSNNQNPFIFDQYLNSALMDVIRNHSNHKPCLVFCNTRKSVEKAAEQVSKKDTNSFFVHNEGQRRQLVGVRVANRRLQELLPHGIAFHHAGLDYADRRAIEEAFTKGIILVLFTTSTLAVGVNLPAHCVVIKSTMQYRGSVYSEYSELDILQMVGRAGRPTFDDSGVAVIMTEASLVQKYEQLVRGQEVIKSSLNEYLIEHLNAECSLKTITSTATAKQWLKKSFLYVCMRVDPQQYRVQGNRETVEELLDNLCIADLHKLIKEGMLREEGPSLLCLEPGHIMAKYYIKFETMVTFMQVDARAGLKQLLEAVCQAQEFLEARKINQGDKAILNAINKSVKFPLKAKVKDVSDKMYLLVQMVLGGVTMPPDAKNAGSLVQEQSGIIREVSRMMRSLIEVCQYKKSYSATLHALQLQQYICGKTWPDGSLMLRQLDQVGPEFAKKFGVAGIDGFEALKQLGDDEVGAIVGRNRGWGMDVLRRVQGLPALSMKITPIHVVNEREMELFVQFDILNKDKLSDPLGSSVWFLCGTSDNRLMDLRRLTIRTMIDTNRSFNIKVSLTAPQQQVQCHAILEEFVGLDIAQHITSQADARLFLNIHTMEPRGPLPDMFRRQRESPHECLLDDWDDWSELDNPDFIAELDKVGPSASTQKPVQKPAEKPKPAQKSSIQRVQEAHYSNGNVRCNHKCGNKQKCRHLCCREGVDPKIAAKNNAKKRKKALAVPSLTESSGKVSLPTKSVSNKKVIIEFSSDDNFGAYGVTPSEPQLFDGPDILLDTPEVAKSKPSRLLAEFRWSTSSEELPDPDASIKTPTKPSKSVVQLQPKKRSIDSVVETTLVDKPTNRQMTSREQLNALHESISKPTKPIGPVPSFKPEPKRHWDEYEYELPRNEPFQIQPVLQSFSPTKFQNNTDSLHKLIPGFKPTEPMRRKAPRVPFKTAISSLPLDF